MRVTRLGPDDEAALQAFLVRHAETSMFLRSNLARAGLVYDGEPYQGEYLGTCTGGGEVCGVLAHYWNGNIMVQAPEESALKALIAAFRVGATRPVAGVLGPDIQVRTTIRGLMLDDADFAINRSEGFYVLELSDLIVPKGRGTDGCSVTPAAALSQDLLRQWLRAYEIEALGATAGEAQEVRVAERAEKMTAEPNYWALWVGKSPVALCGFNASLPDIVQIGPVWTPPEHRKQGHARTILAAALTEVRSKGVQKAVLFTDNFAAAKAYEAIGFTRTGSYRVALLKEPARL